MTESFARRDNVQPPPIRLLKNNRLLTERPTSSFCAETRSLPGCFQRCHRFYSSQPCLENVCVASHPRRRQREGVKNCADRPPEYFHSPPESSPRWETLDSGPRLSIRRVDVLSREQPSALVTGEFGVRQLAKLAAALRCRNSPQAQLAAPLEFLHLSPFSKGIEALRKLRRVFCGRGSW